MSDQTSEPHRYPAGVPCWVDSERADPETAGRFYTELFGWELQDAVPDEVPGQYLIATLDGQDVAAIGSVPPELAHPAPSWITYVAVDDLEEAMAAVRDAGGEWLTGPQVPGPAGRWAACADPQGASFRLWEAGRRLGAQYVNRPGGWNFSVLLSPDPGAVLPFYERVFGWQVSPDLGAGMIRLPGYGDHLAATVDPDIHRRQEFAPPGFADVVAGAESREGVKATWEVRFTVEDRDASAAAAERAGGRVHKTEENEWVREALIADPDGVLFVVSQFSPSS